MLLKNRPTSRDHLMKDVISDQRSLLDIVFQEQGHNAEFVRKVLPEVKNALYNDFKSTKDRKQIDDSIKYYYKQTMNKKRIKEAVYVLTSFPVTDEMRVEDPEATAIETAERYKDDFKVYERQIEPALLNFIRNKKDLPIPLDLGFKAKDIHQSYSKFDKDVEDFLKSL